MKAHILRPTAAIVALAAAACLGFSGSARAGDAGDKASDVDIHGVWARTSPAGAKMGAIYLTLESANGDRLTGAQVPHSVAAETQIHETVAEGDGMTMRQVDSIDLPPGEAVQLKPGGYHIMLIDLKKPLKRGARVPLTLTLEKAGKRKVVATVRDE